MPRTESREAVKMWRRRRKKKNKEIWSQVNSFKGVKTTLPKANSRTEGELKLQKAEGHLRCVNENTDRRGKIAQGKGSILWQCSLLLGDGAGMPELLWRGYA